MKKLFRMLILLTLVFSISSAVYAYDPTKAKITEAIYGTPAIDGEMDDIWKKAIEEKTEIYRMGKTDGATAAFRTMWDEENLYLYVHVKDSLLNAKGGTMYNQDSININIEYDNDKRGSYVEGIDRNFFINYMGDIGMSQSSYEGVSAKTKTVAEGYIIEAQIPHRDFTGAVGKTIGFELAINDADNSNARVAMYSWNCEIDDTWQDTSLLGTIKFIKAASNPKTGDSGILGDILLSLLGMFALVVIAYLIMRNKKNKSTT